MKMKRQVISFIALLLSSTVMADSIEINGIHYNLSSESNEAEVTSDMTTNLYSGNVTIPASVTYNGVEYSVTAIGESAFWNCKGLITVTIPPSVKTMKLNAFSGSSGLSAVYISDLAAWCNMSFNLLQSSPLYYAHHLYLNNVRITNLIIPKGVTQINNYAFAGCQDISSVVIPEGVSRIGGEAFQDCLWLTSVSLPESLKTIGSSAFQGCKRLNSITIPKNITTIEFGTFSYCESLSSIVIPNNVSSIEAVAFAVCSSLSSVEIGSGIQSIGQRAFYDCKLTDVYCYAEKVPATTSESFSDNCIQEATLHVPAALIGSYKTTDPWRKFKDIVAFNKTKPDSPEWVDLGMPSGTLWATCNIGGNKPEDIGEHFAWGETTPKINDFSQTNYTHYKSTITEQDSEGFTKTISGLTKYVMQVDAGSCGYNSFFDNLTQLDKEDDAATVLWGEEWVTPTLAQIIELRQNCLWEWCSLNGVDGYKVTGSNQKYIFLPAALYYEGTKRYGGGRYWSSTLSETSSMNAPCLDFTQYDVSGYDGKRYYGYSIRPVYKDKAKEKKRCAAPVIEYKNGRLSFKSETEGVRYAYTITCADAKSDIVLEGVSLSATYNLSVYATKNGYENSDISRATLCWIDVDPKTEGITNDVASVWARAVMIQSNKGVLNISGAPEGCMINVYDLSGKIVGSAKAGLESTIISTTLRNGDIGIVKIGEKKVKVVIR